MGFLLLAVVTIAVGGASCGALKRKASRRRELIRLAVFGSCY